MFVLLNVKVIHLEIKQYKLYYLSFLLDYIRIHTEEKVMKKKVSAINFMLLYI